MITSGSRVKLNQNMCKQIKVKKLHGTVVTRTTAEVGPTLEIEWDDKDATNIKSFYLCEVSEI